MVWLTLINHVSGGNVHLVGDEIHLTDASGKLIHIKHNDGSHVRHQGAHVEPHPKRAEQSGWVAYADWYNTGSSPISSFTTSWPVPAAPTTYHGQTVFLFNSIEPSAGDAILQPVLQYGPSAAGGGGYWSVASWYLVGSQTYYTPLVKVSPKQVLTGVITLTSITNSTAYNYASEFTGISKSKITATGSAQLVWATETLESYGVSQRSDYPVGSTVFSGIGLKTKAGVPKVQWSAVSDSADGLKTTVNTQGATNAKITIQY